MCRVVLRVDLAPLHEAGAIETVSLRVRRKGVSQDTAATRLSDAGATYAATLAIPDAALWWPHTHGNPALYDAELVIQLDGGSDPVSVDLGRLGFRTLTVDTADGDFGMRINGIPIFCRGANWTPLDVVSPAVPEQAPHSRKCRRQG